MKLLDTFAGIGGFSYAAEKLVGGFETTQFIEINPYCQKVLNKHWSHVPIHDDITTFTAKPGEFDIITGGFPCQDISVAGLQKGITKETRSGLFYELIRVIRMVRPQYVVLENVAAILNRGLDIVLRELSEAGYDAEWAVISASSLGACHQRSRWWLVAYPNSNRSQGRRIQKCAIQERTIFSDKQTRSAVGSEANRCSINTSYPNSIGCGGGNSERRTVQERKLLQREQTGSEMGSKAERCSINTSNSDNNGSSSSEKCRFDGETSDKTQEGQNQSCQSQRSSESRNSTTIQQTPELTYPNSKRLQGLRGKYELQESCKERTFTWRNSGITLNPNWKGYKSKPTLCRGDDGLSNRVDRLKALGNSIVPAVAAIPLQRVKDLYATAS